MESSEKKMGLARILRLVTLVAFTLLGAAGSSWATGTNALPSGEEFFSSGTVVYSLPSGTTAADLSKIFSDGMGPYSSSMDGKIYPYPMPRNGVYGASLYNGCYDSKGVRLGDLDSSGTCNSFISTMSDRSVFRLFLGYKISCAKLGTPGNCVDTRLTMNCKYEQVHVGSFGSERNQVATRYCASGSPIIRAAKGSADTTPAYIGCLPGKDGTTYPTCTDCAPGTFNSVIGTNTSACTACSSSNHPIPHASPQPTAYTGPSGALTAEQCIVNQTLQCENGYTASTDNQACLPNPPPCNQTLILTAKNPSATMSPNPPSTDGSITANVSGATGTPVVSITQPSVRAPSNSGLPAIFSGLSANTYKVSSTDSNCTTTAQITLTEDTSTPSCSSCPSGSTQSGSNCVASPTTTPSYVQYGYKCQGAGGCTSQACYPTCTQGGTFGQVSATNSTPRTCDGNSLYTTFGGSCTMQSGPTTVPSSQSCPSGFSLVAGSCTMACTPTAPSPPPSSPTPPPSGCLHISNAVQPSTSSSTDGKFDVQIDGSGAFTFTISPNPNSVMAQTIPSGNVMSGKFTYSALGSGQYTVTVTGTCSDSQSVNLTPPVGPSCDVYGSSAGSYANGLICNYTCTGPAYPVVTRTITSGTCGGKYNSGTSFCTGTQTSHPECSSEVWAEGQLGCTTGIKPAGTYHTQAPGSNLGIIAGPAEASSCAPAPAPTCAISAAIVAQSNPTTIGGSDGSITVQISGTLQSPQVKDNGTGIATLSSTPSPQNYTITGRSVGSHAITVTQQAGFGCTVSAGTATLTNPVSNCMSMTCPGGKTLRVLHYSQEVLAYTSYCGSSGTCSLSSPDQGTTCSTPSYPTGYYALCSSGNDPGLAILNGQTLKQCSNDSGVPGSGYWNDRGQSCTY